MINENLKERLIKAAEEYETKSFIENDPIQIPHKYKAKTDVEIAGLLTALMSFGNRKQIIAKAKGLCMLMTPTPTAYIKNRYFCKDFKSDDTSSFYRTMSHAAFRDIFEKLYKAYKENPDLETALQKYNGIPMEKMCYFLNVTPKSPQKKINMFLRWMIRQNSCVDFGIWHSFSSKDLIIPLDTHVAHVAAQFGITEKPTYSLTTAKHITHILSEAFPQDPVRGDFALFGLGVNKSAT